MGKYYKDYVIYKGDELVFIGKPKECSEFLGIKIQSFHSRVCRTKNHYYKKPKYTIDKLEDDGEGDFGEND